MPCKKTDDTNCVDDDLWNEISDIRNWLFKYDWTFGSNIGDIRAGPILKDIIDNFKSKERLFLYSSHDSTLIAILHSLGLDDIKWPPYSSSLIFEVLSIDKNDYVRIVYNGDLMKLNWCNELSKCPISKFIERSLRLNEISENCF